jgi:hypothetical protein
MKKFDKKEKFDKKGPKRAGPPARGFADRDKRPPARGFADRDKRPPARGFADQDRRPPGRQYAPRGPETAPVPDDEARRDPYQRVQRPPGAGGGFTVTLDPDVARVFRGDASVNKALRLVIQLMEVAAPRPRGAPTGERGSFRPRPASGGYRGSSEARGFVRKPRFEEEDK